MLKSNSIPPGKDGILRRRFLWGSLSAAASAFLSPLPLSAAPRDIPFFSARSDLEAPLACLRMILSHYDRKEHFPLAEVSEMVSHREGCWIFEAQLLPILDQKNLGPTLHTTTPYADLVAGRSWERYGPGAVEKINREALAWAARFFQPGNFRKESVPFDQIREWHRLGAVMMLGVSRAILRRNPGLPYCRYNIILTWEDRDTIWYHDPSLGPHRHAPASLIEEAYENGPDRAVIGVLPPR